ncbi:hypothetical protein, partial [Fischerella thermalis]|uniref:hypothetical protein n=1 Tax=Fischerella thermalis TaxID=372787 RepID=UPI001CA5D82A
PTPTDNISVQADRYYFFLPILAFFIVPLEAIAYLSAIRLRTPIRHLYPLKEVGDLPLSMLLTTFNYINN